MMKRGGKSLKLLRINKLWAIVFAALVISAPAFGADTNTTVSSTVVTDKTPPTASAPSINVNNSDVCKSASSAAIQTQIFGFASGITVTDENCERIKLARSLYFMGMKVAAVSVLCQDSRVFDGMWMAGTPCPYKGKIGEEARQAWLEDADLLPEGASVIKEKVEEEEKELPPEEEWGE
tara:strand:- start:21979 stop:22515 length:537 start_codon:yes stop_codon:yes gene_type:complete